LFHVHICIVLVWIPDPGGLGYGSCMMGKPWY